jgi:hypothetical protein
MKKVLATLAASAAMIGFAFAGEAEGVVATVDPETRTIMLEDGTSYVVVDGVDIDALAPGAEVRVTFDDETQEATDVQPL